MICPKCGELEDKVVDSRLSKNGRSIRRRRECISCSHRFTTYEEIERVELRVIKTDGSSEPFDKQKILSGLEKPVSGGPSPTSSWRTPSRRSSMSWSPARRGKSRRSGS